MTEHELLSRPKLLAQHQHHFDESKDITDMFQNYTNL